MLSPAVVSAGSGCTYLTTRSLGGSRRGSANVPMCVVGDIRVTDPETRADMAPTAPHIPGQCGLHRSWHGSSPCGDIAGPDRRYRNLHAVAT